MVAAVSTFVFMLATLGLMLHVAALVLIGGAASWLVAWVPLIGIASIAMAVTKAPTPLWEKHDG